MSATPWPAAISTCEAEWRAQDFVSLETLFAAAVEIAAPGQDVMQAAQRLCMAFNHAPAARAAMQQAARAGQGDAANLAAWMVAQGMAPVAAQPLNWEQAGVLEQSLLADPDAFLARADQPYPLSSTDRHFGLQTAWVRDRLAQGRDRFTQFCAARENDTAILVGNGPSLKQTDLSLLQGQDVFISNYAIRNEELRGYAKGVAVSNYLVAEQEPHVFQLDEMWKFHPVWMGHVLGDSAQTVWMQAFGGELFFGTDPGHCVAWHATVTYFWLQILYGAGYRRVLLIGVDNSYRQAASLKEGDLVRQQDDDPNHFEPTYFKGKVWQAADTDHMAKTYAKAREVYEASGRVIINCSVGGTLDVFRRTPLEQMV